MRKSIWSLLVLTVSLVLSRNAYGWGIIYAHPAFTQYAEGGSELASYCDKLLIDWDLTWDFNEWDITLTERMMAAKEPLTTRKTVSEWIRAGCKIEDTRLEGLKGLRCIFPFEQVAPVQLSQSYWKSNSDWVFIIVTCSG